MSRWSLGAAASSAATTLADDLTAQFGRRLDSLVAYGRWIHDAIAASAPPAPRPNAEAPLHTLALVADLGYADLAACADRSARDGTGGAAAAHS